MTSHGLRIGLVAPPWMAVPPSQYGGTEGVIDTLARGLTAQGHHVILFTVGDNALLAGALMIPAIGPITLVASTSRGYLAPFGGCARLHGPGAGRRLPRMGRGGPLGRARDPRRSRARSR